MVPPPEAQTIETQMEADRKKQELERWKILQQNQDKIYEIQQDVTTNRGKTQDKINEEWDRYIRD
jgi:hypothetical protein